MKEWSSVAEKRKSLQRNRKVQRGVLKQVEWGKEER